MCSKVHSGFEGEIEEEIKSDVEGEVEVHSWVDSWVRSRVRVSRVGALMCGSVHSWPSSNAELCDSAQTIQLVSDIYSERTKAWRLINNKTEAKHVKTCEICNLPCNLSNF